MWHTIFFNPIYNSLVFFIDVVRGGDVGLAIICTVILVKLILLPVSVKATRTQIAMRDIEPKLKAIREEYKDKRETQAVKTMELFREAKVNPFLSILLLFIQIPIIIALYFAVSKGGGVRLPEINEALLYSFIPNPHVVSMMFLGIVDITLKNFPLALLAGFTQYIHTTLSLPKIEPRKHDAEPNFKEDFARSMQLQMKYVMPVLIVFFAYSISAAIALYFTISNVVSILQEFFLRRRLKKQK